MEKEYLTPNGYQKLLQEVKFLAKEKIPECIEDIANAQANGGDISENTEYLNALEERDKVESRINNLRRIIDNAHIIDILQMKVDDKVRFGSTVTIYDTDLDTEFTYKIVGELESSIKEGTISYKSPMARSLIGKSVEDIIDLVVPSGDRELEIIKVEHI